MKNFAFVLVMIALGSWMIGSFIEIDCKNDMPNPQYSSINFFTLWD